MRIDRNFSQKDQFFTRVSYFDDPQFKPGRFGRIADGGGFNQGDQIAMSRNAAISERDSFLLPDSGTYGSYLIVTS